jgi:hypothetical protein
VSGLAGLPAGAKIASVGSAINNRSDSVGIFQATVTGAGISSSNNRLILQDNGAFVGAVSRTGVPVAALGGAVPSVYREVLQDSFDHIALGYTLKVGAAHCRTGGAGSLWRRWELWPGWPVSCGS